ncbi:MAG: LamG domain-containing protein [Melioribacteraceae bacterium]|nr:LamG domain-containing protein [Melioribacteraceae bacterium]
MKKSEILITILLFAIIYACNDNPTNSDNNTGSSNEVGKIAFQIDMAQAPFEVVDLRGILSKDGYSSIPFNFFYDDTSDLASVKIDNIPAGNWNLQVDALNLDSVVVYSGATTVTVESGSTTIVNLYLNPTSGSIVINVQWGDGRTLSDLDNFLIGYWDFEDNGIYDMSFNGNNGQVFGNANFSNGKKGNAVNFIGYDGYAEIPNDSIYYLDEKTISFWMYKNNDYILETEGKTDGEGIIAKAYDTGLRRDFTFAISANKPRFHVYGTIGTEGDTLIVAGKTQAISPYIWYHCALVVGENYTEFYLNGKLTEYNQKANLSISTTAPIVLGKITTSSLPSRYFNGKIDEFRIYNKAFNNDEVLLLYYDAL